jgi:hypothetical protein
VGQWRSLAPVEIDRTDTRFENEIAAKEKAPADVARQLPPLA